MRKLLFMLIFIPFIFSCNIISNGTGSITFQLTDAPLLIEGAEVEQLLVTINEIKVSRGTGEEDLEEGEISEEADEGEEESRGDAEWVTIEDTPQEFDLMKLRDGASEIIGSAEVPLEAGKYNQIRLIVEGDNTIKFTGDDTLYDLKIPSGTSSGVKLTGGFEIIDGQTLEILLDFDAEESVHAASGEYILKPVIKIQKIKESQ